MQGLTFFSQREGEEEEQEQYEDITWFCLLRDIKFNAEWPLLPLLPLPSLLLECLTIDFLYQHCSLAGQTTRGL